MGRLFAASSAEFNDRRRSPAIVNAKARKRCPGCRRIIERGERAVLTDDRHAEQHIGRMTGAISTVVRGAWHLWHEDCHGRRPET